MKTEGVADRAVWLGVPGAAVGPGLAGLYETDVAPLGTSATLWPLVWIVLGAAIGVTAGIRLARRGSRLAGGIVVVPNVVVLLYYGFLLFFFGAGGSR